MTVKGMACCGIREIDGLSEHRSSKYALKAFSAYVHAPSSHYGLTNDRFIYAIFSQAGRRRYGDRFAAFIQENKLGEVVETGTHVNPNSGNRLKAWIWTVDHGAVKRLLDIQD